LDAYDLIDVRLPVEVGGRKFHAVRLRLRDVLRILVRFDEDLRRFVAADEPDALELFHSLDLEATADLFAFALDPYDPTFLREHLDLQKAGEVAILIGVVNDIDRIWSALKLGRPPGAREEESPPEPVQARPPRASPLVRVIDRMAERYGMDPVKVLDWPFEAFLTLVDAADEDVDAVARAAMSNAGIDPDLLDDSNIKPGPMPDFNKLVN